MKIAQVRANCYFEFLRIIVMLGTYDAKALTKYDSHVNYYNHADFSPKTKNNN